MSLYVENTAKNDTSRRLDAIRYERTKTRGEKQHDHQEVIPRVRALDDLLRDPGAGTGTRRRTAFRA